MKKVHVTPEQRAMIDRLFEREFSGGPNNWGKLHNISGDPGGWTKYGVSQRANPGIDVPVLTYEGATEFYARRYFKEARIAQIPEPSLQEHVFDFAVNAGVARAVKTLQELVGVPATGFIGDRTVSAITAHPNVDALQNAYVDARQAFYRRLVAKNESRRKFLRGWLARAESFRLANTA